MIPRGMDLRRPHRPCWSFLIDDEFEVDKIHEFMYDVDLKFDNTYSISSVYTVVD